jgi:hypothetical protein
MTDRTAIMQRIINLRELADSSSSEAEAMNAMKIAAKMMDGYRIQEAELALAEGLGQITVDIVDEKKFDIGLNVGRIRHKVQSVIWALETYCEIEVVLKSSWSQGNGIHAIGDRPDVELFWYLLELCRDALDREYNRWKRTQQAVGRGAKASFQLAMAARINQRLREMTYERKKEREEAEAEAVKALNLPADQVRMAVSNGDIKMLSSSMALVVASAAEQKQKAVSAAYASAYKNTKLGTASGFGCARNSSAAGAGRAAGGRVNFGRPVGGGSRNLIK